MEIRAEQFERIAPYLPRQRGNVRHRNITVLNAILWLAENDCKWSALPGHFGNWQALYMRVHRWAKAGVLDRVFEQMQRLQLIRIRFEILPESVDGAVQKSGTNTRQVAHSPALGMTSELPKFAWVPRIRLCHRRLEAARRLNGRRQTRPPVEFYAPNHSEEQVLNQ